MLSYIFTLMKRWNCEASNSANIGTSAQEIKNKFNPYEWENLTESYVMLKYSLITQKRICLLLDSLIPQYEQDFILSYLHKLNIHNIDIIHVSFNEENEIVSYCDNNDIENILRNKQAYILLKYISKNKNKLSNSNNPNLLLLNTVSKTLKIPNYRERCAKFYEYFSKNIKERKYVESIFKEQKSREIFQELLRSAQCNDYFRLAENNQENKYFECFSDKKDEV